MLKGFHRYSAIAIIIIFAATTITLLPSGSALAVSAVVGRFYATCSNFSLDAAINGTTDDGGGQDRFRYLITDGNGKKLYSEDAVRPINVTRGVVVLQVPFDGDGISDGPPSKNPVKIDIVDLDGFGNQTGIRATLSYDAACLPASGSATFSGLFQPPGTYRARMNVTTPLLQSPGGPQIGSLVAEAGKEFIAVYKSADSQYVSIFVGGSDLPWIASGAASVDLASMPVQPTRIEGFAPTFYTPTPFPGFYTPTPYIPVLTYTPSPISGLGPTNVSAQVRVYRLRLRALPTTNSASLASIPIRTFLPVYGKDVSSRWVRVVYNGQLGWVWAAYVRLSGATLAQLPIVQ